MKKYKLTKEKITWAGKTLYRIKALRAFGNITKGELGGYVESEKNLSHRGDCWVYDNGKVYENANVFGNGKLCGNAEVYGNAMIYSDAMLFDNAKVYGNAEVFGNASVFSDAKVYDDTRVCGTASVLGDARVYGNARVYENARVSGDAEVTRQCLNISHNMNQYNITFTDYHVQIGCRQMLYSEWLEVGLEDAVAMGLPREKYDDVMELLKHFIRRYYND